MFFDNAPDHKLEKLTLFISMARALHYTNDFKMYFFGKENDIPIEIMERIAFMFDNCPSLSDENIAKIILLEKDDF